MVKASTTPIASSLYVLSFLLALISPKFLSKANGLLPTDFFHSALVFKAANQVSVGFDRFKTVFSSS
jgi:hypothetical protein